MFVSVFSVAPIVFIPAACSRYMASFMCSTLQIGTLNTAPADVFTVSPFTGAEPVFWTIIPFTPVHSAVLIMAPKLRASESWSRIRNSGVLPLSITFSIRFSRS